MHEYKKKLSDDTNPFQIIFCLLEKEMASNPGIPPESSESTPTPEAMACFTYFPSI